MASQEPTFEDRLVALENLVRKMEGGGLSLDESLTAYEAGMKLSAELTEALNTAEKRMLELSGELSGGQAMPMEDAP